MPLLKDKRVAVVVPHHKESLTPEEEISLRQLRSFLSAEQKIAVVPKTLRLKLPDFEYRRFDDDFFAGVDGYNHLLLSREFYEAFEDFEYILIYQLDCLVFSSDLDYWITSGYDYIGAALPRVESDPEKGFSRVGNGGLSLRRVGGFLDVINSERHRENAGALVRDVFTTPLRGVNGSTSTFGQWAKRTKLFREVARGSEWYRLNYTLHEDLFWSDRARLFCPNFKIASTSVALKFSFDWAPRYCFEQNNRKLPFGCHAWWKWDRKFWEPYLLQ